MLCIKPKLPVPTRGTIPHGDILAVGHLKPTIEPLGYNILNNDTITANDYAVPRPWILPSVAIANDCAIAQTTRTYLKNVACIPRRGAVSSALPVKVTRDDNRGGYNRVGYTKKDAGARVAI